MAGELSNIWWGLILLGLGAGVISGALGVGSGTVLIPAMVLLFCLPQKSAQGTALAVMVPVALLGAFRYWQNPEIDVSLIVVGLLAAGALVGALIGTELAARLPAHVLRKIFAVFILVIAVRMLLLPSRPKAFGARGGQEAASIEKGTVGNDKGSSPDR